jgi:hypothetical protein
LLALATAKERGFEIDTAEVHTQAEFIADFLRRSRQAFLDGKGTGGRADTAGYALLALKQCGYAPDDATAAVVEFLLLYHKEDDHWSASSNRPPSEVSSLTTNYVALQGLQHYGTAEQQERIARRCEQVKAWLLQTAVSDTEERVFRLHALRVLGASDEQIAADARALLATQRDDGGWGQTNDMESDAYATGTALVALNQAGHVPASDPAYQHGLRWLVKTQREDGSWLVESRSKPFQAYYESGFPHGKNQFISCAATGWATTAIALACAPLKAPAAQDAARD